MNKYIIGASPMDGITDAAFRFILEKYGNPDILYTEFLISDALDHGSPHLLRPFIHHKSKKPLIAQLLGTNEEMIYKAVFIAGEMGFAGIDINMGCPDNAVNKKGGGGALINNPKLAVKLINTAKNAVQDFFDGKKIKDLDIKSKHLLFIKKFQSIYKVKKTKNLMTVSVKTRTGFDKPITSDWLTVLLEANPYLICLHGRTVIQKYSGTADWEEIGKAAHIARNSKTLIFGNGDIKSVIEAKDNCKKHSLAGCLIGRAILGNPWFFAQKVPTKEQRFQVMIEHCAKFAEFYLDGDFKSLRKHLAWYIKGFPGAAKIRNSLMKVNNVEDVREVLSIP